jgi:hypothetical protein
VGTDIHLAVQRRNGDRWERVERQWPNPEFGKYDDEPEFQRDTLYRERNYILFAVLVGGSILDDGFRGTILHDELRAIAPGRGLPPEFAAEIEHECHDGLWMGSHSFTWMLLSEVEAYDWDQEITRTGWLSGPLRAIHLDHVRWYPNEGPQRFLSYIPDSARRLSVEELDAEIQAGKIDANAYAHLTWKHPLRESCRDFLLLLPALQAIAPSSDDIRLVVGLDS